MESDALLESYLRQLHLANFLKYYRPLPPMRPAANQDHVRYLLALAEQEVNQREQRLHQRRIKAARFPVLKELADFDFSLVPGLNKAYILDLARGEYITRHEPILFIGNPGLGKTHVATALALAACRQGRKVRFWTAAGLANELLQAQDEHRLPRFERRRPQAGPDRAGRAGLHPLLAHRRAGAVHLLLELARTRGADHHLATSSSPTGRRSSAMNA